MSGATHGARRRQAGAGPKYELVFADRLLATLIHLRTSLTHQALAVIYEVGSSTIGRAISEILPLLAERGFAVPGRPGLRLRTLEDVFAYAEAENVTLRRSRPRWRPGTATATTPSSPHLPKASGAGKEHVPGTPSATT
ncbi:transposase family protein [Streptomyces sp. NPDC056309]|uniref:helix-turn-helix domain-containing protein n=1 Tax=unclassified Streptomyces TaxID=2593676 RepID=UPI0035D9141E